MSLTLEINSPLSISDQPLPIKEIPFYLYVEKKVPDSELTLAFLHYFDYCQRHYKLLATICNEWTEPDVDVELLHFILKERFGLNVDVEQCLNEDGMERLMWRINTETPIDKREAIIKQSEREWQLHKQLLNLMVECNQGGKLRLDSNPAFTNLEFAQVNSELFRRYGIYLTAIELRTLNSVESIILQIIFRMKDGGQIPI